MKRLKQIGIKFLLGALLLNALWFIASIWVPKGVIVSPIAVYAYLPNMLTGALRGHLTASLYRLFIGISIAFVLGSVLAWAAFRNKTAEHLIGSFTYLAYPIPKIALLPVVMLLAGLGDSGKISMIVLILLFQVIVNVRDALLSIPKESFVVAASLGAKGGKVAQHILLPAILPALFSSLRVAIGVAVSVLFVTETYGTERGMGYFIVDAWMRFNYLDMYGGIVVLSITGFLLFIATDLLEVWLCPWEEVVAHEGR